MWMTLGSGFTLLIRRLKRFQKLVVGVGGRGKVKHGSVHETWPQLPPTRTPAHWIMSSSFSTLAKVATLFLRRYRCPGPPCKMQRSVRLDGHHGGPTCKGQAEIHLAENEHLPDLGSFVVDIQLLLDFLCRGRGLSAAHNPAPGLEHIN